MKYVKMWKSTQEALSDIQDAPQIYVYEPLDNEDIVKEIYGETFKFREDEEKGIAVDIPSITIDRESVKTSYKDYEDIVIEYNTSGIVGVVSISVEQISKIGETDIEYDIVDDTIHIKNHFDGRIKVTTDGSHSICAHDEILIDIKCEDINHIEYYIENVKYPQQVNFFVESVTADFIGLTKTYMESGTVYTEYEDLSQTFNFSQNDTNDTYSAYEHNPMERLVL